MMGAKQDRLRGEKRDAAGVAGLTRKIATANDNSEVSDLRLAA
jgi:hypothetical protein